MADMEEIFPRPSVRIAQKPLVLRRQVDDGAWVETVREARKGRTLAWVVAWILIIICGAQAAAIALMLPLREVVPYTILVDRQTGYIETARGVKLGELAEDEAIVQSMAAQYVLARETFDPEDFADRYDQVALWSHGAARDEYVAQFQAGLSPDSGFDLRAGTRIEVIVKKIELVDENTMRVRFETRRRDAASLQNERTDWQAILSYQFTGAPMRMEDRLLNPLGFQVLTYRRDRETVGVGEGPAPDQTLDSFAADPAASTEGPADPGAALAPGEVAGAVAGGDASSNLSVIQLPGRGGGLANGGPGPNIANPSAVSQTSSGDMPETPAP